MENNDFAVFILSHGRANNIYTYNALTNAGYTGRRIILIDDEDDQAQDYIEKYGEEVHIFNKKEAAKQTNTCDNFPGRSAVVFARNAVYDVARKLGIKYFLQLDDDYPYFEYRFNHKGVYGCSRVKSLDQVIEILLTYYKSIPAKRIAIAQGGDFIGGKDGSNAKLKPIRKCMNTFFCSTDRPSLFQGRMNEDVISYTLSASRGELFLTITDLSIKHISTQSLPGGMSDEYLSHGTYVKSFYAIMAHQSSIKIRMMGDAHRRLHHSVKWANTVPKILPETARKQR